MENQRAHCTVSRDPDSLAYVSWEHIDGPMLVGRDGTIHWLTWFERFLLYLNLTTVEALDEKYTQPDTW